MKRGPSGVYRVTATDDEVVRAFVPHPLPPDPPLALAGLQPLLERALVAIGRLDSLSTILPDGHVFIYSYVRKEALLSSQIEGTQSSLSDLLRFEIAGAPGAPLDDAAQVVRYIDAMEHGLKRLREGFPLSNRLIREIHGILLQEGRGSEKEPGAFRRSQNWIGGARPGTALFVPPPAEAVEDCMADLERFLHAEESLPTLLRAGLAHVQFETIHPFLDGNGRVGRLLITLLLCHADVLHEPLLYLSLYFKQRREDYYRFLNDVRMHGDWESWLAFFLEGVRQTAEGAVTTAQRLLSLFQADRQRVQALRGASSALRVHRVFQEASPIISLREASRRSGLSFPTTAAAVDRLVGLGIVRELTGLRRNRLFAYDAYLAILTEGTEPL